LIHEPSYWKQPLLETAQRLLSFNSEIYLAENLLAQIERDIFIGFYSIRKLVESIKVPDEIKCKQYSFTYFPYFGDRKITCFNRNELNNFYNFHKQESEPHDLIFIANVLIHSFIFQIRQNDTEGFDGIFFSSDKLRHQKVFYLSIDEIVSIFNEVGNSDFNSIYYTTSYILEKDGKKKLKAWLTKFFDGPVTDEIIGNYIARAQGGRTGHRAYIEISANQSRTKVIEYLPLPDSYFKIEENYEVR
jgi:hypothetical protein